MTFRERGARLLRTLISPFIRTHSTRDATPVRPPPASFAPPPLPPATMKYVLYRCGDGAFDIYDGDQMVGDLFRQDGASERETVWVATLACAHFDGFTTLKAAKAWLGQPAVRKYRQSQTHRLDKAPAREKRIAPHR